VSEPVRESRGSRGIDRKLEVAVIPVSGVGRSKVFYAEKLGFDVDVDRILLSGRRIV
jgi:hypothetical protein